MRQAEDRWRVQRKVHWRSMEPAAVAAMAAKAMMAEAQLFEPTP